jgi:tRNA threonylcarbamoyladenosine biosynthesis protein TsaB
MAVILALDTSTEACSCALSIDGIVQERLELQPRQHARLLLPMIRDLLAEADISWAKLDAVACGRGPGSFTGLRIAAGVTQGLAFAADLPVLPVSTLAALALDVHRRTGAAAVLALLDARIDEVYWGHFTFATAMPLLQGSEHLGKPETLVLTERSPRGVVAGGNGLVYQSRLPQVLQSQLLQTLPDLLPAAGMIATLAAADFAAGGGIAAEDLRPVYLRDQVAQPRVMP